MEQKPRKDKNRVSVTIDEKLLKWLESQVDSKRFGSKSHGIEVALEVLKKKIEQGEKIEYK